MYRANAHVMTPFRQFRRPIASHSKAWLGPIGMAVPFSRHSGQLIFQIYVGRGYATKIPPRKGYVTPEARLSDTNHATR